jgi:transcriptional regulator with XRE-family HTH domain
MTKTEQLLAIIKAAKLSRIEISKRSGVAPRTIVYWAQFEHSPNPENFDRAWRTVLAMVKEQQAAMAELGKRLKDDAGIDLDDEIAKAGV